METQRTIAQWADETFGRPSSNLAIAVRANGEMSELLSCLARQDDDDAKCIEECADIVIVLLRLAERCGANLSYEVQRKMVKNRRRRWTLDGHGHGQHVEETRGEDFRAALDLEP